MAENGWEKYQKLVMSELQSHGDDLKAISEKVTAIAVELSAFKGEFKVKAGLFGMVGAAIPIAILLAIHFIKSMKSEG